ncbi:hypothetical protein BH23ACT3_BH23ACT3_03160 [soil metagenome]
MVAGGVVMLRPFDDVSAVARLIGAGLLLLGVDFFVRATSSARRRTIFFVNATAWAGIGAGAIVWPDPTVRALAVGVGIGLVVTGVLEIVDAIERSGGERLLLLLGAATSILFGMTALAWPTVTTLVLSLVTGARLVVAAVARLLRRRVGDDAVSPSGWRLGVRATLGVVGLIIALTTAGVSIVINRAQPDDPGEFYAAPDVLPGPPGTVIRSEVVSPFLDGAVAHRVLYVTSGSDGQPITSSGLVIVPEGPVPESGRPVMAFTHGTVGIARKCALSLLPGDIYGPSIPGIREFLDAGFVVAATDYAGLGSEATTGYLVGTSQAYSALDNVRAAISMPETGAGPRFATFGESQGGQAALFTGQLAAEYAPELDLVGVAAAAPATNLTALFQENVGTTFGDVLAAYALASWRDFYGIELDDIVADQALPVIERIADQCIQNETQMLAVVPEAELLTIQFLETPPWDVEPWSTILSENTPGAPNIDAPVLIAQGAADPLVLPAVQEAFVGAWCGRGQKREYRTYDGVGHLDAGHASAADVATWLQQLLEGNESEPTCNPPVGST